MRNMTLTELTSILHRADRVSYYHNSRGYAWIEKHKNIVVGWEYQYPTITKKSVNLLNNEIEILEECILNFSEVVANAVIQGMVGQRE